jgi:hypothetical protein
MGKLLHQKNIRLYDQIKELLLKTKCLKDLKCLNERPDELCKMDYFCCIDFWGDTDIFECLDDMGLGCEFRLPLENRYLCKCSLRIELMKQLANSAGSE